MCHRTMAVIALALLCCTGASIAQSVSASKLKPIDGLQLQAFFHTPYSWQVKVYPPRESASGFTTSDIRVCFIGPTTDCQTIAHDAFSSLTSVKLEMLADPRRVTQRPTLVIRATHSAGSANSTFNDIYVWAFIKYRGSKSGGSFIQIFHYPGFGGEQEFMKKGPLAGAFVSVWQPFTPNLPVRYRIEVYEPAPDAYIQILSLLSAERYPSINWGGEPADPISVLMPQIVKAMRAIYPGGPPHPRL
jgi:hypothetical protein